MRNLRHELRTDTGRKAILPQLTPEMTEKVLSKDSNLLAEVPLYEIISFLNNVGQNWKSEEYSRRKIYVRQLQEHLGYSKRMAENEANWIAMVLASHHRLHDLVATELGHRHILDEWVHLEEAEVRAFPKGQVLHILAGNVPLGGIASILRALVTKNISVVKASSADPFTPLALALSFQDVDARHVMCKALDVVHWPGGDASESVDALVKGVDAICTWGGQSSLDWTFQRASSDTELLNFGPKRSLGIIGKNADLKSAARNLAHDVCVYDQRACFSVQQVFVEGLNDEFLAHLEEALELYRTMVPKGFHEFDEQASWSLARLEAAFLGARVRFNDDQGWCTVVCEPTAIDAHPLGRTIYIHPVDSIEDIYEYVAPDVQTIAVSPWELGRALRDPCALRGVSRFVELGLNNVFRVGGAHDGMFPMHRLVRFASLEKPARVHAKAMTVPIELTKFFEEDRFSAFIPS